MLQCSIGDDAMTTATATASTTFDHGGARESGSARAFDPFGIVSGFRAYRIYSDLDAKSDAELARIGLDRTTIARAAFDAAFRA
jgi:hypothetical protein